MSMQSSVFAPGATPQGLEPYVSVEKTSEQRLLTPRDVATHRRVSPAWVRDHATRKHPRLRSVKLGKLLRFRRPDLEEFIQRWCQ
jgi:hypothetical protein